MIFTPWQKYKTSKAQKENYRLRKSADYASANQLGIVFHNNEQSKIDAADKLSTLLRMDGKRVKLIAYEPKTAIKHLPYETFTKKNFDFWGKMSGKHLLDFVNTDFDFLICLDEHPNQYILSLLANSKAKCRIGRFSEDNQPTFEMLIEDKKQNGINWIDRLYQYIKKLA